MKARPWRHHLWLASFAGSGEVVSSSQAAKGEQHELPCRDACLSLLKEPEGDEIRLGHLINRHLR